MVCRGQRTVNYQWDTARVCLEVSAAISSILEMAADLEEDSRRSLQTRYILSVLELVRKNARFFFAASLAAVALRLLFVLHFPAVVDDSRLYADIAMNWLQHGVYGITDSGHVMPTLSRLPGYPAFLAAIFAIFGWSNFRAVLLIQVLFDLGTCFLIADLARRMFSEHAAKTAFMMAALCPF